MLEADRRVTKPGGPNACSTDSLFNEHFMHEILHTIQDRYRHKITITQIMYHLDTYILLLVVFAYHVPLSQAYTMCNYLLPILKYLCAKYSHTVLTGLDFSTWKSVLFFTEFPIDMITKINSSKLKIEQNQCIIINKKIA